ncbi:MAG: PIN domain-containing protein [Acidobacteria bacterium]|nr:PIN domain-containing protein [Acidobacteriota bacterium]
MLILPDTSCWIEFFRPHGDAAVREQMQRWLSADRIAVCGPVRAEILRGARRAEASRIAGALSALVRLDTNERDWTAVEAAARSMADLGRTVPLLDLLIAAIACRHDVILAHQDAHFRAIADALPLRTHDFLP